MGLTTTFVGVDQDAIGNGDDDETLPIDTWLQRRIQYNNEAMLAPPVAFTWSPIGGSGNDFTGYAGIRPICSFEWATRFRNSIWLYKDQTGVAVTFAYQADTPGNTTQAGTVRVRLKLGLLATKVANLSSTYSSGIKTGHQTVTITFKEPLREAGLYTLDIAFQSDTSSYVTTTIGDSSDGTTSNLRHQYPFRLIDTDSTAPKYFTPNSSGTHPDGDSLEAMWILTDAHSDWEVAGGRNLDLLWTDDTTSSGTQAGTLQKTLPPSAAGTSTSATAFMHVCLMLRSVHVAPVFPDVLPSANVRAAKYAPIMEFGAAEAAFQASEVIRAYEQPFVALVGPRGREVDTAWTETDLDAFATNGYPVCWPSVMGDYDGGTSGQNLDLINEGFYLRTENPVLKLECKWICLHHGAQFNQNQNIADEQKHRKEEGKFDKVDVTVTEGPGRAVWDISMSVHQLADASSGTGDWSSDITEYGTESAELAVPVHGAMVNDPSDLQPPVLRGADSIVHTGKSGVTYPGFWFKEGLLFEAYGDLECVNTSHHVIELSGLTQAEVLLPFRLKLDAELNAYTDPVKVGAGVSNADLRLMLVGFTLMEYPQKP